MTTGFQGTFVISWSQTEVDGVAGAAFKELRAGAAWRWDGEAVRVDGPREILRLGEAEGDADLRQRAARKVRRLIGAAQADTTDIESVEIEDPTRDKTFVVTDGFQSYTVTVVDAAGAAPLAMFFNAMPPRGRDLWVVHHALGADPQASVQQAGVICFTPGTMIRTAQGHCPIEALNVGDKVQTKDNGEQEILWIGARRMSGARLHVMPHLRPIRILANALGDGRPDGELLVSPQHRMLIQGQHAQALFNTDEVLVAAKDLVNDHSVWVDTSVRQVTYIHLMTANHEVLWANGLETESFHPSNTDLDMLEEAQRNSLFSAMPDLEADRQSYGGYARRNMSASEAAILMHKVA